MLSSKLFLLNQTATTRFRQYSTAVANNEALSKLTALRAAMTNVDAFVVPTEDAHQSEYTAECDNRRAWISGFTGSAGCAVITKKKAALFTDGRYFLQASQELDSKHWTLMKQGLPGVPSWQKYLVNNLPPNSSIGIDPSVITVNDAKTMKMELESIGSKLVFVDSNPVDQIRAQDRPSRPSEPIQVHPIQYAGKSVKSKLKDLRQSCGEGKNIVVSLLDEIAWLLNLRGSDIHCSPVFFSYCIVTPRETLLYIQPTTKLSDTVKTHLSEAGVQIKNYSDILNDLSNMKKSPFLVDPDTTNMSILQAIGQENTITRQGPTAITMAKAIKNSSELDGIRKCHKRDAVALCKHFAWLSESLLKGDTIREFEAATHLESMRQLDSKYVGPSFDTISATGPNGAIIHYQPSETNSCIINPRRLYLCDSGAQYLDGTTDITRTFLFNGEATEFQKRAFTRVLQSHISVDRAVFPQGTTGYLLDAIARLPLWKDGLNFRHGIGHGIGAYLNVHEGPHGIGSRLSYNNVPLLPGMMVTNEPGYYQDGEFGIRIENVLTVKQVHTPYRFGNIDSLGFEHVTFVPLGSKNLVNLNLLTNEDKLWINQYHQQVRDVLGPVLEGDNKTLSWLERETEPLWI